MNTFQYFFLSRGLTSRYCFCLQYFILERKVQEMQVKVYKLLSILLFYRHIVSYIVLFTTTNKENRSQCFYFSMVAEG